MMSIFACALQLAVIAWSGHLLQSYITWSRCREGKTTLRRSRKHADANCDTCATPGDLSWNPLIHFIIRIFFSVGIISKFHQRRAAKDLGVPSLRKVLT